MTPGRTACFFAVPAALAALAIAPHLAGCANGAAASREPIFIAPPAAATTAPATGPDAINWQPFAAVLDRYVTDSGRVDYFHVAQSPTYDGLLRVYGAIAAAGPASRPEAFPDREAKLAYYLNAHNLLAVLAIAPHFGPGRIDPGRIGDLPGPPETGFTFVLDGRRVTLRQVRDQCVVPLLGGDPRPLLGLTAGRRNDPPLRRELYAAGRLDAQLADQLRRVLSDEPWGEIDYAKRQVQLPAGVAGYREFYWAGYLSVPGHYREGMQFVTVLMHWADARGRRWLNRGLSYEVTAAEPSDRFNNKSLFRSASD